MISGNINEPLESSLVVITPSGSETVLDVLGAIPLAKDRGKYSKFNC